MKVRIFYIALLLQFSFVIHAQTSYQKFTGLFISNYAEASKPPMDNYFTVLTYASAKTFDTDNPIFLAALKEVRLELRSDELTALDSLTWRAFEYLRVNGIWVSNKEAYDNYKNVFELYNSSLCSCISKEMKKTDMMEKMLTAQQHCIAAMVRDTSFLNQLHSVGGKITLNELYKLQQLLVAYMYQNCGIFNYKLSETLSHTPVYEQYYQGIENLRRTGADNIIKYYRDKQFSKLAAIFPAYKKYTKELNAAVAQTKDPVFKTHFFYAGNTEDNIPKAYLDFFKGEGLPKYKMSFTLNANALEAVFTSVKFEENKEVMPEDDMIIEIREDTTRPVRKN